MPKSIKITILAHTEDTAKLDNLGIDFDINEECQTITCIFYNINAIYPNIQGGSYVLANGSEFMTPLEFDKLEKIINSQL